MRTNLKNTFHHVDLNQLVEEDKVSFEISGPPRSIDGSKLDLALPLHHMSLCLQSMSATMPWFHRTLMSVWRTVKHCQGFSHSWALTTRHADGLHIQIRQKVFFSYYCHLGDFINGNVLENLCVSLFFCRPRKVHTGVFWKNFSTEASKLECWKSNLHCHIDVQPGAAPLTMITERKDLFSFFFSSLSLWRAGRVTNADWTLLGQQHDILQTSVRLCFVFSPPSRIFSVGIYFENKTEFSRKKKVG